MAEARVFDELGNIHHVKVPDFISPWCSCHRCGALHDDGTASLCMDCCDYIDDLPDKEQRRAAVEFYKDHGFESLKEALKFEKENNLVGGLTNGKEEENGTCSGKA